MTTPPANQSMRSRWIAWQPIEEKIENLPQSEPTKPSKPGFVGFEGAILGQFANSEARTAVPERSIRPLIGKKTEDRAGGQKASEPAVDFGRDTTRPMSWAEWKAGALNRLFLEQGIAGAPGRITAETVRHGERATHRALDDSVTGGNAEK
jgi:hypothetical protein